MEKEKIQSLISQMTLEEKAGMCSGADFWHLKGVERLGIPSVMVTDGPHGLRKQAQGADHLGINESEKAICFPAGCATASSFDRELIRKQGELLGQECQAMDVSTHIKSDIHCLIGYIKRVQLISVIILKYPDNS